MVDQNGNGAGRGGDRRAPRLTVLVQYSKDFSFENPECAAHARPAAAKPEHFRPDQCQRPPGRPDRIRSQSGARRRRRRRREHAVQVRTQLRRRFSRRKHSSRADPAGDHDRGPASSCSRSPGRSSPTRCAMAAIPRSISTRSISRPCSCSGSPQRRPGAGRRGVSSGRRASAPRAGLGVRRFSAGASI